ncbi:hypothetical protein [Methylorubrum zatmanii]|uniref:Uncharacterized protein n=2 Tax=Methylorubrum TaxID=2282523 RepID=A0A921JE82_9HYPH|nr:hypothetical protein [Methylorubrum zatmanii]HJE23496.1 hypothetical protein [Methylorubrum populi]
MIELVMRRWRTLAPPRLPSWEDIPLELFVCAAAIFLAAALELLGFMP